MSNIDSLHTGEEQSSLSHAQNLVSDEPMVDHPITTSNWCVDATQTNDCLIVDDGESLTHPLYTAVPLSKVSDESNLAAPGATDLLEPRPRRLFMLYAIRGAELGICMRQNLNDW